jgi:hypothetical protein
MAFSPTSRAARPMLSINLATKSDGMPSVVEGGCPFTAPKMMAQTGALRGDWRTLRAA